MAPDLHPQTFSVLGADVGKTLIRIARDVFPHDRLGDKYHAAAAASYGGASAKDSRLKSMLTEGVAALVFPELL